MAKFSFNSFLGSIAKLVSEGEQDKSALTQQQQAHFQEIENAVLVLAAEVIRCDKNFTQETEVVVKNYFGKQFGTTRTAHRVKTILSHVETGTEPYLKMACKELKLLTTPDSRLGILHFLFSVANADDFINAKEGRCLHRIAGYLGISDADFKELKHRFLSDNNPYKILGLEEDATPEQVKRAYRRMVLKYHPDKRDKDMSIADANHKFREIKRAFEVISKKGE